VTTAWTLAVLAVAPIVATDGGLGIAYARAPACAVGCATPVRSRMTTTRRVRSRATVADVVRESVAFARPCWRPVTPIRRRGGRSTVARAPVRSSLLVRPRARLSSAMPRVPGRRLERDLGASIHVAPGEHIGDEEVRAARLGRSPDGARTCGARAGGCRWWATATAGSSHGGPRPSSAARDLRVVYHRDGASRPASRPRQPRSTAIDVLNVYSLHDPIVAPAERAYLASAYNVVLRDEVTSASCSGHTRTRSCSRASPICCRTPSRS
jgi:hypothetical protein